MVLQPNTKQLDFWILGSQADGEKQLPQEVFSLREKNKIKQRLVIWMGYCHIGNAKEGEREKHEGFSSLVAKSL